MISARRLHRCGQMAAPSYIAMRRRSGALLFAATLASLLLAASAPGALAQGVAGVAGWGANQYGQLGIGSEVGSEVPLSVAETSEATQIAAGEHDSIVRLGGGTVEDWGGNEFGQLGIGTTSGPMACLISFACSTKPVLVSKLSGIREVASGANFNLALESNGKVMAWGLGTSGQLGDGTLESADEPVEVKGLVEVTAIAAGRATGVALLSSGKVETWGANEFGQLGDGATTMTPSDEPVAVKGLTSVASVAAGANHVLARRSNGTIKAWGANEYGQLGNNSTTQSDEPVEVVNLGKSAIAVAAGLHHSLALLNNDTVKAWGANEYGQLGNGSLLASHEPVSVKGLTSASAIAAGAYHSLAILSGGTVKAWGDNESGQLGNGSSTTYDEPVEVDGFTGATAISAGDGHTMAIGTAGAIPVVSHIEPNHGSAEGKTPVTITGSNFAEGSTVKFGSTTATSVKFVSETELIATSPAGTGAVAVTVSDAEGTSALSSADKFTYGPTVASISPNRGLPTGETSVDINGTEFSSASTVKFGSSTAESFKVESPTLITAVSPPGTPGTVNISVSNANGTSPTTTRDQYLYTEPRWYRNLSIIGTNHVPIIGFGQITVSSVKHQLSIECVNLMTGFVWNENKESTGTRAYGFINTWWASGHAPTTENGELSTKCRMSGESASGREGWLDAEPPLQGVTQQGEVCIDKAKTGLGECPIPAGEPNAEREDVKVVTGLSREALSTPWNMELIPKENGLRISARIGVPSEKGHSCSESPAPPGCIRMSVVVPSLGWQLPLEGSLEPTLLIGAGNALTPSSFEFEGEKSGTLHSSSSLLGGATITGADKFLGANNQEMISAE